LAAPKVMKLKVSADTLSVEDRNSDSRHAAKAKLPSMDKIEPRKLAGAGDGDLLINGLERILTQWIGSKSPIVSKLAKTSGLFSPRAPSISIKKYLSRCIYPFFYCSDECFVLALIYIKRLTTMQPDLPVCNLSVHRMLFFAVLLATKFHDDERYSNRYYAKVGGLTIEEVNMVELKFWKMLDWKMYVEPKEYQFYLGLVQQASSHEGPFPEFVSDDEPEAEP